MSGPGIEALLAGQGRAGWRHVRRRRWTRPPPRAGPGAAV